MAALLGAVLATAEQTRRASLLAVHRALVGIAVLFAGGAAFLIWRSFRTPVKADITSFLTVHDAIYDRTAMAHLFDLTAAAFGQLRIPTAVAAFSFFLAAAAALWFRK